MASNFTLNNSNIVIIENRTVTSRPDGTPLQINDALVDIDDLQLKKWNGISWSGADIFNIQNSNSSLLNQTEPQSLFKSPYSTIEFKDGVYNFSGICAFTTNNTNRTVSFQLFPATGTISSTYLITCNGYDSTGNLIFTKQSVGGASSVNIAPLNNSTIYRCFYEGNIWVSNNTKIQPRISMSEAPGGSAVVASGSYIYFKQIGESSTTYSQGNWS